MTTLFWYFFPSLILLCRECFLIVFSFLDGCCVCWLSNECHYTQYTSVPSMTNPSGWHSLRLWEIKDLVTLWRLSESDHLLCSLAPQTYFFFLHFSKNNTTAAATCRLHFQILVYIYLHRVMMTVPTATAAGRLLLSAVAAAGRSRPNRNKKRVEKLKTKSIKGEKINKEREREKKKRNVKYKRDTQVFGDSLEIRWTR